MYFCQASFITKLIDHTRKILKKSPKFAHKFQKVYI